MLVKWFKRFNNQKNNLSRTAAMDGDFVALQKRSRRSSDADGGGCVRHQKDKLNSKDCYLLLILKITNAIVVTPIPGADPF